MNIELTAEIRFRCPCCQKLYCSDMTSFSPKSIAPSEFECLSCKETFFLYSTKMETGLYRTEKTKHIEFSTCPKCNFLKPFHQDECPNCGILEYKFKEIQKMENPRLFEIDQSWVKVLSDLTNDQFHQVFLNTAQKNSALNLAAQKYQDLQKTLGRDPLIDKYLKQIELRLEALVQARFQNEKEKQPVEMTKADLRSLLERLAQINPKDIFMTISLVGTALLIYNKINPTFPNLAGLIIAATVLSYGLWFISFNNPKI